MGVSAPSAKHVYHLPTARNRCIIPENREEAAMRYPKATKEELTAPQAQYRVLGVEIHATSESMFSIGDFDSLNAAKEAAKQKAGTGVPIFIYNDHGELIVRYGSWH